MIKNIIIVFLLGDNDVPEVVVLKFNNGEEVIGEVDSFEAAAEPIINLRRPLRIGLVRGPNGQPAKAMMDWFLAIPEPNLVPIRAESLATYPIQAPKDVADEWRQQTSGIVLSTQING